MFEKRKGFTIEHIQGLDCNVPPVGKVWDNLFDHKLVETGVHRRSEKKSEQYWERTPLPKDYKKLLAREEQMQVSNPGYVDADLEAFRRQEWFRRINGFWFMNNGVPTYITGNHYFYLNCWRIDIGYPHFRDTDRKKQYFLQYCVEDPDCGGMVTFEKRRGGKTYIGAAFVYEGVSRMERVTGGFQSKSREDARDVVFTKALIEPFQYVPDYFVPEFDTSQGKRPKTELRFFAATKKGKNIGTEKEDLASVISFKDASEKAYDGQKIKRGYIDEFGKSPDVNVVERHRVLKYCILQDGVIDGFLLYGTTVEDMRGNKTVKECKQLWDGSDQSKRDKNNRTETLMYRYFIAADESTYFDRHGMSEVEKAREYLENMFESYMKKGDFKGLASERRKNPLRIEDVFESGADNCLFDPIMLNQRISDLIWQEPEDLYDTGSFHWENNEFGGKPYFRLKKNGNTRVRKVMAEGEITVKRQGNKVFPKNKHIFAMGVDPFDYKTFIDGKMSMGCAYVFCKNDPDEAMFSESLVCEYYGRPTPNAFYEDMLKIALYYGCNILVESNKTGMIQWFEEKGFGHLLTKMPGQKNPGVPSSEPSKQMGVEIVEDYFVDTDDKGLKGIQKVFFPELLQDALDFDIRETEKYDRFMAFLWTMVAARLISSKVRLGGEYRDISEYFKTYGGSGILSH